MERDKFMSADEAKSFGLIDKVVEKEVTNRFTPFDAQQHN